jgi:site-specific DNA-methyltransferase (adenine-specific)
MIKDKAIRVPDRFSDNYIEIHHGDSARLPFPDNHFDCLVTDPPYGYGFMGKDWDKAVVPASTWREVLRVMKPGAFGFVMSAPRQDVLGRMIVNLQEAGFETGFTSIYWTYATGFPKAANIGKMVDKRLGVERESLGPHPNARQTLGTVQICKKDGDGQLRPNPATPEAAALDGAYAGFQPKPAVEVILVVMKPLTEKGYLDQAMKDGKGVTWLEAGRIPYEQDCRLEKGGTYGGNRKSGAGTSIFGCGGKEVLYGDLPGGRFPANLLVSDDVLDDGRVTKGTVRNPTGKAILDPDTGWNQNSMVDKTVRGQNDTGDFSRYFNLDAWWEALPELPRKTFPFLIVPKASKAEKNHGCQNIDNETYLDPARQDKEAIGCNNPRNRTGKASKGNIHPTVKPIKLMSYLIAIGSRPGDLILDPFMGSGTTLISAKGLGRCAAGVDNDPECIPVAEARVKAAPWGT